MTMLAVLKGELRKEANVFVGFIDLTKEELSLLETTSGEYCLTNIEEFDPETGEKKEVYFKLVDPNEVSEKFDSFRYISVLDNPNIMVNGKNYYLKTEKSDIVFNFYAHMGVQMMFKKEIGSMLSFDFNPLLENERVLFNEDPYEKNKLMISSKTGDLYFLNGNLYKFEHLVNYHSEIRYSVMLTKWDKKNKQFTGSSVKEIKTRMFYVGKIVF